MFFRGRDSDLRREKRDEGRTRAAGAAVEGATSCWTIYIADPHRPQRWRAQMMAMMTAIVRSGEAAASDRGREQDSNRGKCLTSPAPRSLIPYDTSHRETEDDRDRAVDVEGQLQLPHKRTERRECGGRSGRRTDPSLNPSLSRSSRFFTPKCDRRSRRIVCVVASGKGGREEGRKGSHTEESNGTRLLPAARAPLRGGEKKNGFLASFTTHRPSNILAPID